MIGRQPLKLSSMFALWTGLAHLFLLLLNYHDVVIVEAQCNEEILGPISLAGASAVGRVTTAWLDAYRQSCGGEDITPNIEIETGMGSSDGASRVCGTSTSLQNEPVNIGGMARPFDAGEATTENGWQFDCARSTRTLIQVEIASEGISAATKLSGSAATCIELLNGLSFDQLRWIFTSYDEVELERSGGWDAGSVPNSDNDPSTHLWSELDSFCPEEEILIAFPDNNGSSLLFKELIFVGVDETFATDRNTTTLVNAATNEEMIQFLLDHDNAISYFELAYVLSEIDQELISLVPVVVNVGSGGDGGEVVEDAIKPSAATFETGEYPMARRLYMNLYNDEEDDDNEVVETMSRLQASRSLLEFGYSQAGDDAIKSVGLWPLHEWEKLLMLTRVQSKSGVPWSAIEEYCSSSNSDSSNGNSNSHTISIAGSSTVFPVAQIWSEIYRIGCPGVVFSVEGGGSSAGAGRVCDDPDHGSAVDIGDMSRDWKDSEAEQVDGGYLHQCKIGDTDRSAIQMDVAIDGLTIAVKEGGTAWECIELLGGGLSVDQLRWIYSDYTDGKLEETGWDPASLQNSDRNSQTHLWSELDPRCPRMEIRIAGPDDQSGTYDYFLETVLTDYDNGETFDLNRPGFGYRNSALDEVLVAYVNEFAESISFFGYSYYFANRNSLSAVGIVNGEGQTVLPDPTTIANGSYNPLARRIYMNLYNNEESLKYTAPFIEFGLNNPALVEATGYVAIPQEDVVEMTSRLSSVPDGNGNGGSSSASGDAAFSVLVSILTGAAVTLVPYL